MEQFTQLNSPGVSKRGKNEIKKKSLTDVEKKERRLSIGIYTLVIIITASLMLIIFTLILKG